ncbi:MAG: UvrD-helicase domain-containing protein [Candidatus Kariarchaeaceae archaeon]
MRRAIEIIPLVKSRDIHSDTKKSYKIIGLPGTGKTYTLLQIVKNYVSNGIDMKDIIYCSHTKAAIEEVKERIVRLLPHLTGANLHSVKTMHSLSYQLVKKQLGRNMSNSSGGKSLYQRKKEFYLEFKRQYQHIYTFLKSVDYDNSSVYDLRYLDTMDELHPSIFFTIHENLQIKIPGDDIDMIFEYLCKYWSRLSLDEGYYEHYEDGEEDICEEMRKLAIQISYLFHQQWSLYKQEKGIFEFNDLLIYCINNRLYPNSMILIMDEFQDFSPLQYEVFKIWADNSKVSIIAGDPNQAIYGFQNSSPQFLMDFETSENEIILDVSYRLPPKIIEVAQKMIASNNYMDSYKSHVSIDREGTVESVNLSEIEIDPEDTVFVLCRTNSMIDSVSEQLRKVGIVNTIYPRSSMNKNEKAQISKYYDVIRKLVACSTEKIEFDRDETKLLLELSETPQDTSNVIVIGKRKSLFPYQAYMDLERQLHTQKKKIEIDKQTLIDFIDLEPNDILPMLVRKLHKHVTRSIQIGIKKGWTKKQVLNSIDQVKVMTIHKSKGKEADLVIIINRATHYEKRGEEDEDEERRIWYVAVTRAKNRLVIASYNDEMEYTTTKYL